MRNAPVLVLVCLLCALPAFGLEPYLVKDINPLAEAADSDPAFFDNGGPVALLAADDGLVGRELWRSDGTAAGTWLVADTCQPECSGTPAFFAHTDRATFFLAADGDGLNRLWATDGTPAGTFPLTDRSVTIKDDALRLAGRNVLYFGAEDDEHGLELWRSDGTPTGTHLVTDLRPGPEGSGLLSLVAFKGRVYFSADDGRVGGALWKTDGTAAGTVLVKDPDPSTWANERPEWLRAVGNRLVFLGPVPGEMWDLWSSDGTGKGTQVIGGFARGETFLTLRDAAVLGSRLYLVIDDGRRGQELWVTDGTLNGTRVLTSLPRPDAFFAADGKYRLSLPRSPQTAVGKRFVFLANDGPHGVEAWVTDGTVKGTRQLRDVCPGACDGVSRIWEPALGRLVLMTATDPAHGREVWATDGTIKGTRRVLDLCPGSCGSDPFSPFLVGNRMLFGATGGGSGVQLWATDGQESGTVRISGFEAVEPFGPGRIEGGLAGGQLLFAASGPEGKELWRADGTGPSGTRFVRNINQTDVGGSRPRRLMALGNQVIFFADGADGEAGLWRSDGTGPGTVKIKDLGPGRVDYTDELAAQTAGQAFFYVQGDLYFIPWRTDGTEEGTYPLAEEGPWPCCVTPQPGAVGNRFFFPGRDADHGAELWVSDGTAGGTRVVRDILPGNRSSEPLDPTSFQGKLYFTAWNDELGRELWRSDGTEAGTVLVKDIDPLSPSEPMLLTVHAGRLWFFAYDGEHGRELWVSDGTEAGTKLAVDLEPGPGSFIPNALVSFGNRLLISGPDQGIWVTDGTPARTRKIADRSVAQSFDAFPQWAVFQGRFYYIAWEDSRLVLYGSDGTEAGTGPLLDRDGMKIAAPRRFAVLGDRLLFTAGVSEVSMWESDGTPAGTFRLRPETFTGPGAGELVRAGSRVFFPAYGRADGVELWAVDEGKP